MILIPAIDLKDGKCVRLEQGDMNTLTIFSDDPSAVADHWVEEGAKRLHIVDLDGAVKGEPMNADLINDIIEGHPDLPIQVGGGIRNANTVDIYIQAGVSYVIIGTQAIKEPQIISNLCAEFPTHVIVGLDAKDGKVATEGWSQLSNHNAIDMVQHFESDGVEAIIYTDIDRDGMMQGLNIKATAALAEKTNIPVIASGGIQNIDNVKKLAAKADAGIVGAIIGRGLYEGTLDFAVCQQAVDAIIEERYYHQFIDS